MSIHFIGGPLHGEVHDFSLYVKPLPPMIYAAVPCELDFADLYQKSPVRVEPWPIHKYRLHEIWHCGDPIGILATDLEVKRAIRILRGEETWRPPRVITASVRSQIILSGMVQ